VPILHSLKVRVPVPAVAQESREREGDKDGMETDEGGAEEMEYRTEEIKFDRISVAVGSVYDTYVQHRISEATTKRVNEVKAYYQPQIDVLEEELRILRQGNLNHLFCQLCV
jgi:hypothetical protein